MNAFDKYMKEKSIRKTVLFPTSSKSVLSKASPNCRKRKAKLSNTEHFRKQ